MLRAMAAVLGLSSSMLLERPLDEAIDFARRQGFRAFEVWADHPHAHPDEMPPDARQRMRRLLTEFERVSMHGPLGNASVASINPGIRLESVRQHIAAVELAHDLGATVLVVHPGDLRDRRFKGETLGLSCDALATVSDRAAALGVTIAVENCGPYLAGIDQTAADLATIVRSLGSRGGVCVDTGHAAVNGNATELVTLLGDAVAHFHVHDNHGARDEHLPIGAGTIDFSAYLPLLTNFEGIAVAEIVWERARSTVTPEALALAMMDGWSRLWGKTS
jgi:sugar phosphate isomerase/epimerase